MPELHELIASIAKVVVVIGAIAKGADPAAAGVAAELAERAVNLLGSALKPSAYTKAKNSLRRSIYEELRQCDDILILDDDDCINDIAQSLFSLENASKMLLSETAVEGLHSQLRVILDKYNIPCEEQALDIAELARRLVTSTYSTFMRDGNLRNITKAVSTIDMNHILALVYGEQQRAVDVQTAIKELLDEKSRPFHDYVTIQNNSFNESLKAPPSKNPFDYKANVVDLMGRDKEMQTLRDFLNCDGKLRIITITGSGGLGKSRLAYEFAKERIELDVANWSVVYFKWEAYNRANLNENLHFEHTKNILFIIDYILAEAEHIGKCLSSIKENISTVSNACVIRVIITERNDRSDDSIPPWYDIAIRKTKLDDLMYEHCIQLPPIDDGMLVEVAQQYIASRYNQKVSANVIRDCIVKPLRNEIDPELVRPLFVLYMAEAYISNEGNIRGWNRNKLLDHIDKKETERIRALVGNEQRAAESLENLLVYATAAGGLTKDALPEFLWADWEYLKSKKESSLTQLFNGVNMHTKDEPMLEPMLPDILGEYYCLCKLDEKRKNDDTEFIRKLVQAAWWHPDYYSFAERLAGDFPQHKLVNFEYLFIAPGDEALMPVYWSFLLILTYRGSVTLTEQAVNKLKDYYAQWDNVDDLPLGLLVRYARGLFNLSNDYEDIEKKRECVDLLSMLALKYQDRDAVEVAVIYAEGLFNLSNAYEDIEKKRECVDLLRLLELKYQDRDAVEVAVIYAEGLFNLSHAYEDIEKKRECVDLLSMLALKYQDRDAVEVAVIYAKGLFNLSHAYEDIEKKLECINLLRELEIKCRNKGSVDITDEFAYNFASLAFDCYENKHWNVAESLFYKAFLLGCSGAGTNLAYMIRRGEAQSEYEETVEELLSAALNDGKPYAKVNHALYLAINNNDWERADRLFGEMSLDDAQEIQSWWRNLHISGDPEGLLVLAWLQRFSLLELFDHKEKAAVLSKIRQSYAQARSWIVERNNYVSSCDSFSI